MKRTTSPIRHQRGSAAHGVINIRSSTPPPSTAPFSVCPVDRPNGVKTVGIASAASLMMQSSTWIRLGKVGSAQHIPQVSAYINRTVLGMLAHQECNAGASTRVDQKKKTEVRRSADYPRVLASSVKGGFEKGGL